jgi:hypothetical protein
MSYNSSLPFAATWAFAKRTSCRHNLGQLQRQCMTGLVIGNIWDGFVDAGSRQKLRRITVEHCWVSAAGYDACKRRRLFCFSQTLLPFGGVLRPAKCCHGGSSLDVPDKGYSGTRLIRLELYRNKGTAVDGRRINMLFDEEIGVQFRVEI